MGVKMADHSRSRSRSPLWSRSDSTDTWIMEAVDSNISLKDEEVPRELKQQRVLTFKNVPFSWEKSHIIDYIKKYCDDSNEEIAKSIQDIVIEKDLQHSNITLCLVKFAIPDMAQDAKILLATVKDKYEGKRVSVDDYRKDTTKKRLQSANASCTDTIISQNEANETTPIPNEVKMETDETDETPNNFMKITIKTVQSLNETIDVQNESTETNPLCEQALNRIDRIMPEQYQPKHSFNVLSIRNVPASWDENKVIEYIKTHADRPNNGIEDSMEAVIIKRDHNNEILACLVQFTTFEMSQAVKFRLSNVTEKIEGKKIYVVDYRTKFDIRSGPDSENNDFVDPNDGKKVLEHTCGDPWILLMKNVPNTWTKLEIEEYVKTFTDHDKEIAKNLLDISIGKEYTAVGSHGVVHLKFSTPKIAKKAHAVLTSLKIRQINSKIIKVFRDKSAYVSDVFDIMANQNNTLPSNNDDQQSSNTDATTMLLLSGIHPDWQLRNVSEHIKRTTSVKKEIAANIEGITLQKFPGCIKKNCAIVKFKNIQSAAVAKILLMKYKARKTRNIVVSFYKPAPGTDIDQPTTQIKTEENPQNENRTLCLRNVPKTWTSMNIKKLIENYTNAHIAKAIQYIHLHTIKGKFCGVCIVRFSTVTFAALANNQLRTVTDLFDGNKIHSEFDNTNLVIWTADNRPNIAAMNMRNLSPSAVTDNNSILQFSTNPSINTTNLSPVTANPSAVTTNPSMNTTTPYTNYAKKGQPSLFSVFGADPTSWHIEPKLQPDQYGLTTQFLNSHGLTLPLQKHIFVENLDSQHFRDKENIRKLFSVAGTVSAVQLFYKHPALQAKVEFEHPVEAVQALSMFNNQIVHGLKLLVTMDNKPYFFNRDCPDGVTSLGPGLGKKGMPLRDIKHKIEFHNFKKSIQDELGKIKSDIREIKALLQQNTMQTVGHNQNMDTSRHMMPGMNPALDQSAPNDPLFALRHLFNPQALEMLQSLMQQNASSTSGSNTQSGYIGDPNTQMGLNTAGGMDVQITPNIQGGLNMHNEQIMMSGLNVHGEANMHSQNVQGGQFIHGAPNIQAGPYIHGEPIVQGHMQGGQFMQGQFINGEPNIHGSVIHGGPHYNGVFNTQNGSNVPSGMLMHSVPNIPANPVMHTLPNMPSNPVMHTLPNMPSNPVMHTLPNMPSNPVMHTLPNIHSRPISPEIEPEPSTTPRSDRSRSRERSSSQDDISARRHKSVLFNKLPPSVSLKALKIKMREFGDVQMAALSSPGRAVVVFTSPRDAAACVKRLDGSRVDGQTIEVMSL